MSTEDDTKAKLNKAFTRAAQGGIAGASAMAIQVCTLMWMRTAINYQDSVEGWWYSSFL